MNTSRGNYRKTPNSFLGSSCQRHVWKVTTQFNIYEATFPENIRPARRLEKTQNGLLVFSVHTRMHTHARMRARAHTDTHTLTHTHTHTHTLTDSGPSLASPLGCKRVRGVGSRLPIQTPNQREPREVTSSQIFKQLLL